MRTTTTLMSGLASMAMLLSSGGAQATDYTFPGNLPTGCSVVSAGNYSCSALTLQNGDKISIASPSPATITVNGAMSTNNAKINSTGAVSDLNFVVTGLLTVGFQANINANVTAGSINAPSGSTQVVFGGNLTTTTGNVTLEFQNTVAGSISSTTGSITLGQENVVGGNIISTSGAIIVGYAAKVGGSVSTSGTISLAQNSSVTGSITGSSGKVDVGYGAMVSGAITTSSGAISFAQASQAGACVKSTSSAAITLGPQVSVNSVCCGSSCGSSCVAKGSNPMPPPCISMLAEWRMDESSWNGSASEVKDSSGNAYHGTAKIASGATLEYLRLRTV